MVRKKGTKRKILIEDKRIRDDGADEQQAPSAEADSSPAEEMLKQQLREFEQDAGPVDAAPAADDEGNGQDAPEQAQETPGGETDWRLKATEYLELAQRKEAEMRNLRKRIADDKADARRFAIEGLLYDLFPALDGLSQAAHTFKDQPGGENPLLDGVRSTIKVMTSALMGHGIEKISEDNVPFDANLHQALSVEESADVEEQTVAEIYVEGYRLGDRVLKPAMVRVLKPAGGGEAG